MFIQLCKSQLGSYDSLPLEKILKFHNFIIRIKSVLNEDQNHCYYSTFLQKFSYQLDKRLRTLNIFS